MGTKAKLSTKVLSFLLSALMAVSCFGIALPSLAPEAKAATADFQPLRDALDAAMNGGYLSTDDYTVTVDANGNASVNDTTKNGYLYAVVRAVGEIAKIEGVAPDSDHAHNALLAAYICDQVEANEFQRNFITAILPSAGQYKTYDGVNGDTPVWNGTVANMNASLTETFTFTTTVTRDVKGAVLTDYDSSYDVPAQVDKTYTLTFTGTRTAVASTNGQETGAVYKNTAIASATATAAAPDLSAINAYLTFVNDADLFANGFAAWQADPKSVYNEAADVLETRYNTFVSKMNAANGCDADYVEKYIGAALMNEQWSYAQACLGSSKTVVLKKYVDWINGVETEDVAALPGYLHRNNFTETDIQRIAYLRDKAQSYLNTVNAAGAAVKELLADAYGYNTVYIKTADTSPVPGKTYYAIGQTAVEQNGETVVNTTYTATAATDENIATLYEMVSYEAYIADMNAKIELWNLADLKAGAQAIMNSNASNTYTFPANSRFSTYALTSDTDPVPGKTYYEKDAYGLYVPAEATAENISSLYEAQGLEYMCMGSENYKSEPYVVAGNECPVDDLSLEDAYSFFQNANAYIASCNAANKAKAGLTADVISAMTAMENALYEEIAYRSYYDDAAAAFRTEYDYFVNLMLNTDPAMMSNDALIGGYQTVDINGNVVTAEGIIGAANSHWNTLNAQNSAISTSNASVKARYNAFVTKCYNYVSSMYATLVDRSYTEYNDLYVAAGSRTDGNSIGGSNFSLVKGMIANLDDDRDTDGVQNKLLTWLNSNSSTVNNRVSGASSKISHCNNVNSAIPAYLTKANAVSAQHWNGYTRYYNDHVSYNSTTGTSTAGGNDTGVYTVRDGRADDMVRADNDKDYVVTRERIESVITKLDTFAASTDFVKLIGVYDESTGVTTLKKFVNDLLIQNLFSDDMVNTFVSLLFPMLSDLLQNKLVGMLIQNMGTYGVSAGPAGYDARLDLHTMIMTLIESGQVAATQSSEGGNSIAGYRGTAYLNTLQGNVDIALNGNQGTQNFEALFSDLGIKIFPNALATYLRGYNSSLFSELIAKLESCGNNWMNLDANHDGTLDKDDLALLGVKYGANGVRSYNDFVSVMGGVLGAAGPLVNTLFTNHTYVKNNIANMVFVKMNGVKLDVQGKAWLGFSPTLNETVYVDDTTAMGTGNLQIDGMLGYNELWVPVMEMLGITGYTGDYSVSSYSAPLSNRVGNAGANVNTATIVNDLFFPLMALIDKVSSKPIDTVLGMLPNLAYNVAYDNISVLMNCLQTALHITASVELDVGDVGIDDFWFGRWDLELGWLASLFEGKIEDMINGFLDFDIPLDIGGMVDLPSKLPFDITNLNDILKYVLGKMNDDTISTEATANVPAINAGHLGGLGAKGTISSSVSSQKNYITADKADVFYELIQLVMDFISKSGNLSGLMASFSGSGLSSEINDILAGIDADKSLAALVELFVPQTYKMAPYTWYQPNTAASTYTFNPGIYAGTMAQGGFVYMKYGNNWTREKAQYMYDNLEKAVDDIMNMIDSEMLEGYTGFSDWLLKTINKMFRNKGVNDFLDILIKLATNLDSEGKMLPNMLKDQLKVSNEDNMDIYSWYYRFGYLYPELRTLGTHEVTEVDQNGNVVTRTVNEVLYVDKNGNVCVGYPQQSKEKIDGQEVSVTVMNFVRTYPLAPSGFAGFTTDDDGENIPAASGSNLPGRVNQANITYYYSPKYSSLSTKRYDNYATCNVSADGQYSAATFTINGKTFNNKNRVYDANNNRLFNAIDPVILSERDEDENIIQWKIAGNANTAQFGVSSGSTYTLVDGEMGTETTAVNPNVSARAIFTAIFASLIEPLAPALSFILNGKDLNLFNSALTVKGYDVYNGALVPLFEAAGITDLYTSDDYKSQYNNNATGGFYYLANKVFVKLTEILTNDANGTPTQKIINLLPGLYYFLQSDGLGTLIKNVLFPIWVLVDDVRPLVDVNLDQIIHGLAGKLFGVDTNTSGIGTQNAVYNLIMKNLDLEPILKTQPSDPQKLVNAINGISLKNLTLKAIANLAGEFTGMNLQPLFYAFEGMCFGYDYTKDGTTTHYGVVNVSSSKHYDIATYNQNGSKNYTKTYTLKYLGPDVITVTISAVLDLLRYQGNAQALDELIGLARELLPGETLSTAVTATGLLDGLEKVFAARANDNYTAPNWDYLLEGKAIKGPDNNTIVWTANTDWRVLLQYSDLSALDIHNKHDDVTKRALGYKTDWTRETAVDMDTMFKSLLDWLTTTILAKDDAEITGFEGWVNNLIDKELLGADTLKSLVGLIAKLYQYLPASVIGIIDSLLDTNLLGWAEEGYFRPGDPTKTILDKDGNPEVDDEGHEIKEKAGAYYVNETYEWWATTSDVAFDDQGRPYEVQNPASDAYVDSRDEFFDAITALLTPVTSLFGFIFLEDGYKFFYTAGNKLGQNSTGGGTNNSGTVDTSDDDDAIILEGLGIWGKGLIPLLEAMGIRKILEDKGYNFDNYAPEVYKTNTPGKYNSSKFLTDFVFILRTFAEGIVADPVNWLLDNLANIIYFINAEGISTAAKNVLDSVADILDMINTRLDASERISTSNLAGINLNSLTLDGIFKLVERFTAWEEKTDEGTVKHPGLHVRDDLVEYIKDLYFGVMSSYVSANGKDAFRMDPLPTDGEDADKAREDRANLITVFVALVLEIAEDKGTFLDADNGYVQAEYDNPALLDHLFTTDGLVSQIIEAVKNPQDLVKYKDVDWFYFDDNFNIADAEISEDGVVEVPAYVFQYLNYTTKWTYDKALATSTGLEKMVISVLKYVEPNKYADLTSLGQLINVDTFYNGEVIQNLYDMLAKVLFSDDAVVPAELLETAGALLGADFSAWAVFDPELESWTRSYAFASEDYFGDADAAETEEETGLKFKELPARIARVDEEGKQVKDEDGKPIYDEGDPIKTYLVNDRASFVAAVTLMLKPAYRLLDWLLFNDSYEFFNGNTAATENDILITLPGCEGYANGLVLLLEALGCEGLKYPSYYETENGVDTAAYMSDILTSVADRIDKVCENPVDEIVGMLPELIYFINAGGLQVSVANILAGPLALVNSLQALAGDDAGEDADAVVNKLVGDAIDKALADMFKGDHTSINFTLNGINLQYIFEVVEAITGLEITDCVGNRLAKFYMGELYRYNSMGGETNIAYKMTFSNEEDFADFITIAISLIIDVLLTEGNDRALVELLPLEDNEVFTAEEMKALILEVIEFLKDNGALTENLQPIDWLYFDDEYSFYDPVTDELKETLPEYDETAAVNVPARFINYLTYASDWTDELAHYIYNNRNELVLSVLKMANAEDTEVMGIKIADLFNGTGIEGLLDKLYTAQNLNAILKGIQNLTTKVPAALFDLLHIVLDMDFSKYDETSPNFIGYFDEETNGGVMTKDAFVDGLYTIVSPLSTILDWLLFGQNLEYFDKDTDLNNTYGDNHDIQVLLSIAGANGYDEGLIPLLEALGIEATHSNSVSNTATMLRPILKAVLNRAEEILANPVDEILALLPNLLYFINARGLISSVQNLLAGPMALINKVNEELDPEGDHPEKRIGINTVLNAVDFGTETSVDIMKLDLKAILTLVEELTGLQIIKLNDQDPGFIDAEKIEYFYFGKIELSKSANGKVRGTMSYTDEEDAADMLTIIVNLAIEFALYEWEDEEGKHSNAAVLEGLIEDMDPGTITGIIDALDTLGAEAIPGNYHWNYFNEIDDDFDNSAGYDEPFYARPRAKNLFMNYLTYDERQSWTQATANALYQNLGTIIDKVLTAMAGDDEEAAKTVSDIIKGSFNLYTAKNLNTIVGYIEMAYDKIAALVDLLGLVLGADLTGWHDMAQFTDEQITDRETFRAALVEIIKPLYPVLDWLLFGKDYGFFVKDEDGNIVSGTPGTASQVAGDGELIKIQGANGYAYGLVPLLTILGVKLPACKVGETTCGTKDENGRTFLDLVIDAVLTRLDAILANPVDEALALLPQILYFINANGAATMVENLLGSVKNAADVLVKNGTIPLPEGTVLPIDEETGEAISPETIAEYVYDLAGVNIDNLDLEGIIAVLEQQEFMQGLKINEVFTVQDLNGDGKLDNILEYFYMGAGAQRTETSVTNKDGTNYAIYKLSYDDTYVGGDVLTTLLCIVLEVLMYENDDHTANAAPLAKIVSGFSDELNLTAENIEALRTLLHDGIDDPVMGTINWAYVYDYLFGGTDDEEAARLAKVAEILGADTNALNALPERTVNYLTYDAKNNPKMLNLWSESAVRYVDANLNDIVDRVINMVTKGESEDLSAFIKNNVDLFTDENANAIVDAVVGALAKLDELMGAETTDLVLDTLGRQLGVENLPAIRETRATGIQSAEDFVDFLAETFAVLDPVLDWVLFGKDYRFFTELMTGEPHTIILKGGEGYKYGLAPILDALGVDTMIDPDSADESALHQILANVADRIQEILDNPIDEVLDLLPELIYFINADGLTVCANNLIAPVDELLKVVGENIGRDLSLNTLITAVDLNELNFSLVYKLLADNMGIILSDEEGEPIGQYLSTFYFGELKTETIYDGLKVVHMVYNEEDTRYDMVTILVTLLLDVIVYDGNRAAVIDLLKKIDEDKAEGIYNSIIAILTHHEVIVDMVPYRWILTEYDVNGDGPEAGKIVFPSELGATLNHSIYGPLYTREMGEYITKFFPLFVDTYITLLGIEIDGINVSSLDELLKSYIGDSIYKTSLLQTVAGAVGNAIENLRETLGDDLFNYVKEVLERSLKVDLTALTNIQVPEIEEGDREGFVNALCDMFSPVAPILRWLLTDQDIALFTDRNGDDYIVLEGARGYQDSIIPIMEALHVPADSILTQAEYEAATDRTPKNDEDAAKDAAMLTNIVNPLLDRVDEILDDPLNQIFDVLPALAYFVNSKGLDSAFKNALNAVFSLLTTIDPAIADIEDLHKNGEVSLYPLMSKNMAELDLEELDFDALATLLIGFVNTKVEDYGFELTGVLKDAISELSCGIVRSFDSKREDGHPDYTMDYAGTSGSEGESGDKVDMATIVLRLVLHFISYPENVVALEALLKDKLNEEGYKFLCSLLENFQQFASTNDGMDKIMYTVYYVFYAALNAGVATNNGLAEFNGNYSFLNQLFATSDYDFIKQLEKSFGDLLNKWTSDVVDDDEVAPKGFIKLFQGLIDFFRKILRFFQNLFG